MENEQNNVSTPQDNRPWYKKKRYLIPIGIIILYLILSSGNQSNQVNPDPVNTPNQSASALNSLNTTSSIKSVTSTNTQYKAPVINTNNTGLSNSNYYTNTYGNEVHSPAYSNSGSVPTGASAKCRDGTYSFSQSRRGTCSHHGGVSQWL